MLRASVNVGVSVTGTLLFIALSTPTNSKHHIQYSISIINTKHESYPRIETDDGRAVA